MIVQGATPELYMNVDCGVLYFCHTLARYAEYISVPSLDYLVTIPAELPLPVASMLPTGALWALNAVFDAKSIVDAVLASRGGAGTYASHKKRFCDVLAYDLVF